MSNVIENKYSKEWKEYLVQMLKLYAKTLEENAEEIIGDYSFTGDLSIMFTLPTDQRSSALPSISVSKDYFPSYRAFGEIYGKFRDERLKCVKKEKNEANEKDSLNGNAINHCKTNLKGE